jgi:intein-encoded DNA endonuclease-like protein
MAYVLGFLYADGNIVLTKRGNHYIALYTADRKILEAMKRAMGSKHYVAERRSDTGCVYRMQIGSKEWFDDLQTLGLTPNKASRMRLPNVPLTFIGDFVRGYFDGDGNVWVGDIHTQRTRRTRTLQVSFTSGSYEFLEALRTLLHRQGLQGGSLFRCHGGTYARLTFSVTDALKLAEIMYNMRPKLYLQRKKLRFDQFQTMRP